MSRIKSVVPKDYRMEAQFNNGSSLTPNLESRLWTVRFGMLSDK